MAPPNFHLELLSPKIQFHYTLFFYFPPSTLSVTMIFKAISVRVSGNALQLSCGMRGREKGSPSIFDGAQEFFDCHVKPFLYQNSG